MATGVKRIKHILKGMKQRCYNKNHINYKRYGGRGITVCDEWLNNSQAFVDWALSHGYADDLTIDRIDNNGNYEPDNCRWATQEEQQHNKSSNVFLTYKGKTQDIKQWADDLGVYYVTLWTRYKNGWDTKRIIEEPIHEECRNRYPDIVCGEGEKRDLIVKEHHRREAGIRTEEQRREDDKKHVMEKVEIIRKELLNNPTISIRKIAKNTGIPRSTVQRLITSYLNISD